jgi:type II secretory pathway pseudopilin PulG
MAILSKLKSKKSFTLVELIFEILVLALVVIPTAVLLVQLTLDIVQTETNATATALGVQTAESVMWNYTFNNIPTVSNFTHFTNPVGCTTCHYDEYSYTVGWQWVAAANLDTPVATPPTTDYKKVTITVRHAGIPDVYMYILFSNI